MKCTDKKSHEVLHYNSQAQIKVERNRAEASGSAATAAVLAAQRQRRACRPLISSVGGVGIARLVESRQDMPAGHAAEGARLSSLSATQSVRHKRAGLVCAEGGWDAVRARGREQGGGSAHCVVLHVERSRTQRR